MGNKVLHEGALALVLQVLVVGCSTVPTSFHPAQPIPPHEFSHQAFDEVLKSHVKDGVVDYPAIAKDARFAAYLEQLDRVDPNALPTRRHKLAFWINAYNAFASRVSWTATRRSRKSASGGTSSGRSIGSAAR